MQNLNPTEKKFENHIENILIQLNINQFIMKNMIVLYV